MEHIIIEHEIACGGFSKVYKGKIRGMSLPVAVKIVDPPINSILAHERKIMEQLPRCEYFPQVLWFGSINNKLALAMDLMGQTLESYLSNKEFLLYYPYHYSSKILTSLHLLHKAGYIHKDIKPTNICLHLNSPLSICLIDFGISELYLEPDTKTHKLRRINEFEGNLAFCSENVACGISPSRRDDLESLCYLTIYMIKKNLPWLKAGGNKLESLRIRLNSRNKLIKNVPSEIKNILDYCKSLTYEQKPDYKYIGRMFNTCYKKAYGKFNNTEVIPNKKRHKKRRKSLQEYKYDNSESAFDTIVAGLPEITPRVRAQSKYLDWIRTNKSCGCCSIFEYN
ncbi:hypothetical protein SteCoe_13475 [Stentor coeruleus]|uniref:Casein kinase I n=1 Tax=Stentor coeruleus TaxID=5963 RepID=A0A1R2C8B3_9CILI|nr:hypothetical protein SteCoe_13475 [Stentor coeruleus]